MCMLTFLPPGILPNTDRLRNGTESNRDGHGWAIVVLETADTPAHILTGHSMNPTAAIEAFRLTREKHPEGPALFHSRYTTGGLVDESNCHPYVVNGDARTILAHNGVLPWNLKQPAKDDRSDTRYFCDAWGYLLYPGAEPGTDFNLNSRRGRRRLRDWLGNPNKFVVLTVDPTFRRNYFILNSEQGIWEDDGCWYSNSGYKQRTYGIGVTGKGWKSYGSPIGYKSWWEDAEGEAPMYATPRKEGTVWDRLASATRATRFIDKGQLGGLAPDADLTCNVCRTADGIDPAYNYCQACGTCGDCYGDALDEWSSAPCDCAWPTGTHPGRRMSLERAFAIREELNREAQAPVNIGPPDDGDAGARAAMEDDTGTGWPGRVGQAVKRALTSAPHVGDGQ